MYVSINHFTADFYKEGSGLLSQFSGSPVLVLMSTYPHHKWERWRFRNYRVSDMGPDDMRHLLVHIFTFPLPFTLIVLFFTYIYLYFYLIYKTSGSEVGIHKNGELVHYYIRRPRQSLREIISLGLLEIWEHR